MYRRRKLRSHRRNRHRIGGGRSGGGGGGDAGRARAASDQLVGNDERHAGQQNDGERKHDAEASERREKTVKINGVAKRESEEGDHQLPAGGEKVSELGIEIAEREADQERKHGANEDLRFE